MISGRYGMTQEEFDQALSFCWKELRIETLERELAIQKQKYESELIFLRETMEDEIAFYKKRLDVSNQLYNQLLDCYNKLEHLYKTK